MRRKGRLLERVDKVHDWIPKTPTSNILSNLFLSAKKLCEAMAIYVGIDGLGNTLYVAQGKQG